MAGNDSTSVMRGQYQRTMLELRGAFEAGGATGAETIAARAGAVDELVTGLWQQAVERDPRLVRGWRWWRWVVMGGGSCFLSRMWICFFCWMGSWRRKM